MNNQCLGVDPTRAEFNTVFAVDMAEDMKDMRLLEKFVIDVPSSSINLQDSMTVNTLLHHVIANCPTEHAQETILKLLQNGADVTLENAQKALPLEMVFNHHKSKWTFLSYYWYYIFKCCSHGAERSMIGFSQAELGSKLLFFTHYRYSLLITITC